MELASHFGGLTLPSEPLAGVWLHRGQRFDDSNVCVVVDVEESPETGW